MTNNEEFGARLREARKKKGLTQKELTMNLSYVEQDASVSAYEKGKQYPSMNTIEELCDILDVTADWLLFGKEHTSKAPSSNEELILQFVSLMDQLHLRVEPVYNFGGVETGEYMIKLSAAPLKGIEDLSEALYDIKSLYSKGHISKEYYDILIAAKIKSIAQDTNDYEYIVKIPDMPGVSEQINQWLDENEPPF